MSNPSAIVHAALRCVVWLCGSFLVACDVFDVGPALQVLDAADGMALEKRAGLLLADTCDPNATGGDAVSVPAVVAFEGLRDHVGAFDACGYGDDPHALDGFFAVDASRGERWHVMAKPEGEQDVRLFVLRACDERSCVKGQDQCGAGGAEHLNFVAETSATYRVVVESTDALAVEVFASRLTCGDGVVEHGETCDDGNDDACLGCRKVLRGSVVDEVESNDDVRESNVLAIDDVPTEMRVRGVVGGPCDVDRFYVNVPAGALLRAKMLDAAGAMCDPRLPADMDLELATYDDVPLILAEGTYSPERGGCPSIEPESGGTFMQRLDAGEYLLSVRAPRDADPRGYTLSVSLE